MYKRVALLWIAPIQNGNGYAMRVSRQGMAVAAGYADDNLADTGLVRENSLGLLFAFAQDERDQFLLLRITELKHTDALGLHQHSDGAACIADACL